jgi:prepilin-type processing-associated H-X9-DG protein
MNREFKRTDLLVITAVVGFLLCVGVAWWSQSRRRSRAVCCNCNMKQITLGFKVWAGDHFGKNPMEISVTNGGTLEYAGDAFRHFQIVSNELNTPFALVCTAKDFSPAFSNTNVSYFAGLDADDSLPQMFLAGDRNVTNGTSIHSGILTLTTRSPAGFDQRLHNGRGNIGLADGSVQTLTREQLWNAVINSGSDTNRLAMP